MGVAPQSEELPASGGRHTVQVAPAPPPLPKLDPLPAGSQPALSVKEPLAKEASSKHPTLMMFEPQAPSQNPVPETSQPIVVPANEPSAVTNAVTRPPPWGEGAVEMDTQIPKSPAVPNVDSVTVRTAPEASDRPSEAPRPMELSSSDLSSEARIAVVKAAPLAAPERPTQGTIHAAKQAQESVANVPPPAPLSHSDVASTNKWASQPETRPGVGERPSGAKLHDLRAMGQRGVLGALQRAYDMLRERTKNTPWVLPVIGGFGVVAVLILLVAGVKAAISTSTGSSASSGTATSTSKTATTGATSSRPPKGAIAGPMACQTSGPAHTVAPKALIASGVEAVTVASQVALGFAVAPKEAALEILDPATLSSASTLHLHATDNVRRVLALDASQAAVDSDHKGDRLQGRRTVPSNPPIDLGATDGTLVWAPHGGEKGKKLWSLVNPDAPVEALRGEPLPNGSTVVTFRSNGAIWFGVFGGTPPAAVGNLRHIDGLGPQVGSPAVATSGEAVMVAWADRASPNDFWSIRYVTFKPGDEAAPQAKPFALPAGGLGEQAMSPALASLGAGRFLFVWTEGPVSEHQVRGAVVEGGVASGVFTASPEGVNAGQGQAAVLADGRGVVAFLSASQTSKGFEVAATPIQCVENK
jgi:hypothetical protein